MERIRNIRDFFRMYVDGFKQMTWGRSLWIIILVKLFIMFAILKVFFFKAPLSKYDNDREKSEHVMEELTKNHIINEKKVSNGFN
jgi:hypothetical protein